MARAGNGFRALARFHLAAGARLAAVVLAPAFAAGFGAGMLLGVDFLSSLARLLYGSDGPRPAGAAGAIWIGAVAIGAARTAAPRVCRGLSGWMRHLPADGLAHRRAAALAIFAAQLPLVLLLAVLAPVALHRPERLAAAFLGLLLAAAGGALFAVPVARPLLARPLAGAAALIAGGASWPALGLAALLLAAADLAAGPLPGGREAIGWRGRWNVGGRAHLPRPSPPPTRAMEPGSSSPRTGPREEGAPEAAETSTSADRRGERVVPWGDGIAARTAWAFGWRISWRALGWRLAGAYLAALLPLAAAALFVAHNALAPGAVSLAARLGGGAAVVLFLAQTGEALAVARPAWPWARSLPQAASARVASDALFLGAHAAPLAALAGWISPWSALPLALSLPYLALRAAGALRRAPERRTGASGEILLEGMWLAAAVALLSWAALALAAAAPWAARLAAERERRQKVSRWLEIHHLAAGDPQSWSAQ
jgi:hypothetical protein